MKEKQDSSLFKKAAELLAHRPYSRGELRKKLAQTGDESQLDMALDRLEQLNLLNDADYAYNFALYRIQQEGWGPAKVTDSLLRHEVAQPVIERALERVLKEAGEESYLVEYIEKHCRKQGPPTAPKDIRKLVLHLARRGFDENHIFSALKRIVPAEVFRRFETGD